jgi:hypothetical protein
MAIKLMRSGRSDLISRVLSGDFSLAHALALAFPTMKR